METPISARAALLSALIAGKGFGLELSDRVRDRTRGTVKLGHGSVYPALHALEAEGLVKGWNDDQSPERGGRPRRYYELTAAGLRAASTQAKNLSGLFLQPKRRAR